MLAMPESRSQIGFEQIGLGAVLKQNQLDVPANQREYAWTDDEVTQLFQDFSRALAAGDYFLGTIVTIPRLSGSLEVVDGQQRLATTAILLAAIRDYLSDRNEPVLVEAINNDFLTGIDRARRTRIPKLKLNLDDNDLFQQIVSPGSRNFTTKPGRDSHERLVRAYKAAMAHVRKVVAVVDEKDHGDVLNTWVSFIENQALIVLLRVPNDADAFRMFETLNARGLSTSQVDLIKNYLFAQADQRLPEVQSRWSFMRGALEAMEGPDIDIDFLRHSLIALTGPVREKDIYRVVQERARGQQGAVTFSGALESLSNIYVATFNSDHERWASYSDAGVRRAIQVLNLLNVRPMRPLILAIAAKADQRETRRMFDFLIALSVRLMIASSTRSEGVEAPLSHAAQAVFEGTVTTTAQLKKQLEPITPRDNDFTAAFARAKVSNARLARYFLRSLESSAKSEPEPYFIPQDDPAIITLEHILPRKPEGNWPGFGDDDARSYTTRLGNLVLMRASDNSDSKSKPFSVKKPLYASSPYVLTSQVGDLDDWTADTITARQDGLAKLAAGTWRT